MYEKNVLTEGTRNEGMKNAKRPASASLTLLSKKEKLGTSLQRHQQRQLQGNAIEYNATDGQDEENYNGRRQLHTHHEPHESIGSIGEGNQMQERARRYLKMNSTRQPRFWKYTKKFDVGMRVKILRDELCDSFHYLPLAL
jgi:hypothetical protein